MWNFLLGFLFARATGISRFVRPLLVLVLFGALIAGVVYAFVVLRAVNQRSHASHVHTSSIH
jgi:hypothetical protein